MESGSRCLGFFHALSCLNFQTYNIANIVLAILAKKRGQRHPLILNLSSDIVISHTKNCATALNICRSTLRRSKL